MMLLSVFRRPIATLTAQVGRAFMPDVFKFAMY